MAHLILLRNPLTPHEKEEHELAPGQTAIEWLQENYPTGFGMPIRFYVNADEKPLDDLDYVPDCDDIIIIALMPGGFLAAMPLLVKVVIGLAVMAAAYFAMQLFAPKPQKIKQSDKIDVFNVSSEQSAAKVGSPIPVIYGEVWTTPNYITQPYTWFKWAETTYDEWFSGVQYLDVIMCLGEGVIEVTNVKAGDSDASSLGSNILMWRSFAPNEHRSTMGVIQAAMGGNFYENVVTNLEVGNQEFIKKGDTTPYYTICKSGTKGRFFQIDLIFSNGLYFISSHGNMRGSVVWFTTYWQEVDQNGNQFGPVYSAATQITSAPGALTAKNPAEIANPFRRTVMFDAGRSARWAVRIERTTYNLSADEGQTTFIWSGLKLIGDVSATAYGNVTLLAARIKASRGIGSDAAVRISAKCKRWLNGLPNGEWQHSKNPADAFYDVYTNSKYAAGRPLSELDVSKLNALRSQWRGYEFNHVFSDRTTIWEALKTITVGLAAEPLPLGSLMSVAQDGVKPLRSMLFTDANIVEGSMKVSYMFDIDDDSDGIEVKYINPADWQESFVRFPIGSIIPETVELAGCTNATHAAQYARLVWQRTRKQRKRITFDTELEGIILQLGDRIAVSHEMPKWGDNGIVLAISGTAVTVDHDLDWSGGGKFMMFRRSDGTPSELYPVTQGAQPNVAILGTALTFTAHVDDEFDYTSFAFGTSTTMVRDFTVSTTRHTGDTTVTVEAVNYAPEIFDGAMTFLGGAP